MERNCCNRHVTVITFLTIIIIITVIVVINSLAAQINQNKKVLYGLVALLVIEGLALLIVASHFIHSYMLVKQVTLEKVF
jgi:hypothetical protein